jgi:hypothetical protein
MPSARGNIKSSATAWGVKKNKYKTMNVGLKQIRAATEQRGKQKLKYDMLKKLELHRMRYNKSNFSVGYKKVYAALHEVNKKPKVQVEQFTRATTFLKQSGFP